MFSIWSYVFRNGVNTVKRCRVYYGGHNACSVPVRYSSQAVLPLQSRHHQQNGSSSSVSPLWALSVLGWLGFEQPKENIDHDLIMNIKWGILLLQKKEYKKSERMLHLALRMAQQLQNQKAVTYIYDIMANLAMETEQYEKAEKLFKSVMERLLGSGYPENHIKNVHISLKIARCYHLSGNMEKAGIGYRWVISNLLKENTPAGTQSPNLKLLAIAKDWYGHYLNDMKQKQEAVTLLLEAFNLLKEINDEDDAEQIVCLINDIGTIYHSMGDLDNAEKYIKEAIRTTRKYRDDTDLLGVLYVNLGNVVYKKGSFSKAKEYCTKGSMYALHAENVECTENAKKCLKMIENMQ